MRRYGEHTLAVDHAIHRFPSPFHSLGPGLFRPATPLSSLANKTRVPCTRSIRRLRLRGPVANRFGGWMIIRLFAALAGTASAQVRAQTSPVWTIPEVGALP